MSRRLYKVLVPRLELSASLPDSACGLKKNVPSSRLTVFPATNKLKSMNPPVNSPVGRLAFWGFAIGVVGASLAAKGFRPSGRA